MKQKLSHNKLQEGDYTLLTNLYRIMKETISARGLKPRIQTGSLATWVENPLRKNVFVNMTDSARQPNIAGRQELNLGPLLGPF